MIDKMCLANFLRTCFRSKPFFMTEGTIDEECKWLSAQIVKYIEDIYVSDKQVFQGQGPKSDEKHEKNLRCEEG